MVFMQAIRDFSTISYICFSIFYQEIPLYSILFLSIFRDILQPPSCCSSDSFFSAMF